MSDTHKLSVEEAAAYLDITPRTLQNWRDANTGPKYYKPTNKLVYYFKNDLDDWIKGKENDLRTN